MRYAWYWVGFAVFSIVTVVSGMNDASRSQTRTMHFAEDSSASDVEEYSERRRPSNDKDCRDFSSHEEAQAFFEDNDPSEDAHYLDGDDDGIACERLR